MSLKPEKIFMLKNPGGTSIITPATPRFHFSALDLENVDGYNDGDDVCDSAVPTIFTDKGSQLIPLNANGGATKPKFRTSVVNGKPGVEYTDPSDIHRFKSGDTSEFKWMHDGTDTTLIVALKFDTVTNLQFICGTNGYSSSARKGFVLRGGGTMDISYLTSNGAAYNINNTVSQGTLIDRTAFNIIFVTVDWTNGNSPGTCIVYLNDLSFSQSVGDSGSPSTTDPFNWFYVGDDPFTVINGFDGHVFEKIGYDRILNLAEMTSLNTSIKNAYGF